MLLSIDTLKTGVVLDALTHSRHDSNRELLAQGLANLRPRFVGGMPGAGTMGATLVNITSGGRTLPVRHDRGRCSWCSAFLAAGHG